MLMGIHCGISTHLGWKTSVLEFQISIQKRADVTMSVTVIPVNPNRNVTLISSGMPLARVALRPMFLALEFIILESRYLAARITAMHRTLRDDNEFLF